MTSLILDTMRQGSQRAAGALGFGFAEVFADVDEQSVELVEKGRVGFEVVREEVL